MKLYICEDVKNARWRKHITHIKNNDNTDNNANSANNANNDETGKEPKVSHVFIKKCICDFIGEKEYNTNIIFAKNDYGKPYIDKIYIKKGSAWIKIDLSLFFSLSHSDDLMICAVACFNIGADCQMKNLKNLTSAEQCRKIAKRFYSDIENKFLDSLNSLNSTNSTESIDDNISDIYINHFFKIWTKKEAYIKYTGKGLAEGLNTFSVTNEIRQKKYFGDVYFKRILLTKLKKYNRKDFYIYLCYNKDNKNVLEIKYFR